MEEEIYFKRKALLELDVSGWTSYDDGSVVWNPDVPVESRPTEEQISDKAKELKDLWYKNQYQLKREKKYPKRDDLIVAMWEMLVEGKTEEADKIQEIRKAIKEQFPKPTE
jgi:signal recognition particle subunit SEC65